MGRSRGIFRVISDSDSALYFSLLYYFNLVQTPMMAKIPADLKPGVSKYIAPEALFWFRWAAASTVLTGLIVATLNGYVYEALTLQRGGNSKVVLGSLEAIPVAGRMLYVEPVYTQSSGGASFPVLRHVIALYGDGQPSFDNTLQAAIKDAVGSATAKA